MVLSLLLFIVCVVIIGTTTGTICNLFILLLLVFGGAYLLTFINYMISVMIIAKSLIFHHFHGGILRKWEAVPFQQSSVVDALTWSGGETKSWGFSEFT